MHKKIKKNEEDEKVKTESGGKKESDEENEKFVPVVVDRTTIQRCRDKKCSKLHLILSLLLCRPWRRNKGSTRPNLDSSENLFNSSSIGSTRPNLDSPEKLFNTTQQDFVSVVNRTLQGHSDQNLSTNKLHLPLSSPDSQPPRLTTGNLPS
ncbi:3'-5'exonuclease domain-containing protein / K homologydomain-containing protein / KH domain-containing protein [Striga asiatica]|uniref:3'-5'exonuclease domain-containing protein / K homologydomain-containing protein / KH domain-containing protein n=1 Tax=Striga asiatica TaxID=4170 RepID=A0A5A7QVS6_STRAF|nr:3'-5'exonuclease domain-containing protein / K homologydomain-containing protein / KH domain-containing protein [Striga asiatica]